MRLQEPDLMSTQKEIGQWGASTSYATYVFTTICMGFLHTGHPIRVFCKLRAQWKHVTRWAVRPCTTFPFLGRCWQSLQGSKRGLEDSSEVSSDWQLKSVSVLSEKLLILDARSNGSKNCETLSGPRTRTIGADTVLRQSGMSTALSVSWELALAGSAGVERACTRRGQSEYQSLRKAQQRKQ